MSTSWVWLFFLFEGGAEGGVGLLFKLVLCLILQAERTSAWCLLGAGDPSNNPASAQTQALDVSDENTIED